MDSREFKDIILNYELTDTLLKENLDIDFKNTIIGITNSIIELAKYYYQNEYLIDELLLYLDDIISKESDTKNLKFIHSQLKGIITKMYKDFSLEQNTYLQPLVKRIQYLSRSAKGKVINMDNLSKINIMENIIYKNRNLKVIQGLIRDNKDILKIKDANSENILYKLLKQYNDLEEDDSNISYLYQVISFFINNDDLNIQIMKDSDYYLTILDKKTSYVEEVKSLLEKKKEAISLSELENKYQVFLTYPAKAEEELYTYQFSHEGAIDLRNQPCFTIDDEDARCLDDAIYIEKNKNGTYTLYVHITYMPSLIPYNSLINKESIRIAETRYLIDGSYSLYPDYVSNYLASLLPNNIRHTETGIWLLDSNMNVIEDSFKLVKSNIMSHQKLTYEQADDLIEDTKKDSINKTLYLLGIFALKQRKKNSKKEKYRLIENSQNPDKKHESLKVDKLISANIVQETALLFGKSKALLYKRLGLPFIYRACGNNQDFSLKKEYLLSNDLENLSNMVAYYTEIPSYHHGLGYQVFSHTTSPARRSPDGQNQYIDEDLLFNSNIDNKIVYLWEDRVKELAKHYNETIERTDAFANQYNYLESKKLIKRP